MFRKLNCGSQKLFGRLRFVTRVAFLDTGRLAAEIAQVIELCPADLTATNDVDVVNDRCVKREDTLDAYAETYLADRDGLTYAAMLAGDTYALEGLQAFLVAFLDPVRREVPPVNIAGSQESRVFYNIEDGYLQVNLAP